MPPTPPPPLRLKVPGVAGFVRAWCCSLLVLASLAAPAFPQDRAGAIESASRATVFLRVIGDLDVIPGTENPTATKLHRSNVELATGSGFIFTPLGQVLTCHHVIASGERTGQIDGRRVKVATKVTRVEVYVPSANEAMPAERFEATVLASSPDLDLAVLSIAGSTFPAAELGDSDALEPGDGLDALGFPFGRDVEIGLPATALAGSPGVSVSHGDFSAFRQDDAGNRRFLQTTASVNPGNSGGPILDADGYVVGIVSRRLSSSGAAIGFAVPVNLVKSFLESNGLDAQLPVRRLSLGAAQSIQAKGVRLRMPWGFVDNSPYRARVETQQLGAAVPTLRIDRVLSSWDAARVAAAVSSGEGFESFSPLGPARQKVRTTPGPRLVTGRVSGTTAQGEAVRVEFAVLDLGGEKLVARYVAPPGVIAFNASVLRASLASLDGEVLRNPPGVPAITRWTALALGSLPADAMSAVVPGGWIVEPQGPLPCRGVNAAAEGVSASPTADFARSLRVGFIRQPGLTAVAAATACRGRQAGDAEHPSDYQATPTSLGARYFVEGRFVELAEGGLLQLEVLGPAEDRAALHALFQAWTTPGR